MAEERQEELRAELLVGNLTDQLARFQQTHPQNLAVYARGMLETMVEYKELLMMYTCAIKEVQTKFEVLNVEFSTRNSRNPIASIHSRLKSTNSILEKMVRRQIPFSIENIEQQITDIAGVRIICSYVDDIYQLADALTRQDDITLVTRKDYIANPKPNGYRSLHLIIRIPVFFSNQKREMNVEVQIRTIAMDFWASLEHQIKYKQEVPGQAAIVAQLKECADAITAIDEKMLSIRQQAEAVQIPPAESEALLARLSRLTNPIL